MFDWTVSTTQESWTFKIHICTQHINAHRHSLWAPLPFPSNPGRFSKTNEVCFLLNQQRRKLYGIRLIIGKLVCAPAIRHSEIITSYVPITYLSTLRRLVKLGNNSVGKHYQRRYCTDLSITPSDNPLGQISCVQSQNVLWVLLLRCYSPYSVYNPTI